MSRPRIALALAAVAALPAVAFADLPNVQLDHAWSRATPAGSTFAVALTFAKAGEITATVNVRQVTATMPAMDHGGMGEMPGMQGH